MALSSKVLAPGERLMLTLRAHIKVLFVPVLILLATVTAATVILASISNNMGTMNGNDYARIAIVLAALLVIARWSIWPFAQWWFTVYAITDRRLITRTGVLARNGHDMPLTRLNDVQFSHSVIERMLGCGTLVVESAGESGQLELHDIPKVEQVQRLLYELAESVRHPRQTVDDRTLDDTHNHTERQGHDQPTVVTGTYPTMVMDSYDEDEWR